MFKSFRQHLLSKTAFFSLALWWKWQESTSASPWSNRYVVISPNLHQLCKSCSGLRYSWENRWFWATTWNNWAEVLEACNGIQLSPFHLDLPLATIGVVCNQFVVLSTDLHHIFCWFCRDFHLRPLVLPLPQLEQLCSGKPQTGNISVTYANLYLMFFQGIRHNSFEKNVEKGEWQKTFLPFSDCCSRAV